MNFGDASMTERFWSKVIPEPNSGCWLWIGATTPEGYGTFAVKGATRYAHREILGEIADGLVVDHKCRTRSCCNPAHLEPVTNRENSARGAHGDLVTHCPYGHEYTVENTITVERPGRTYRRCRECSRISARKHKRRSTTMATAAVSESQIDHKLARLGDVAESLKLYAEHRVQPGDFLIAVLSNDLMGAVGRADDISCSVLVEIARMVYKLPRRCWGSREIVNAWLGR